MIVVKCVHWSISVEFVVDFLYVEVLSSWIVYSSLIYLWSDEAMDPLSYVEGGLLDYVGIDEL